MGSWQRIEAEGFRWTLRTSAREELEEGLLRRGADPGPALRVAALRRGRSFHELPSAGGGLFVKRLVPPRYDTSLLYRILARRVRGQREFRNARRAFARGVEVPEPLAFGVRHRPFHSYESRLVYRRLPSQARSLQELPLAEAPLAVRERIAMQLGGLTARMHARGVFHMDLTPPNALLVGDPGGDFRLVAVDLERLELGRAADRRRAARSIERTAERFGWAGSTEYACFLEAYHAGRTGVS